jgi:hypothetical protein
MVWHNDIRKSTQVTGAIFTMHCAYYDSTRTKVCKIGSTICRRENDVINSIALTVPP